MKKSRVQWFVYIVIKFSACVTSEAVNKSPAVTIETKFPQAVLQSGVMLSGEF